MKKAFVISWYFPPVNSSEGLVTFKLLKNSKYKYDVFTQKNNLSWTYGDREDKLVSDNITPIFSSNKDINSWIDEGVEYFKKNYEKYDFIMSRSNAPESHVMAYKIKQLYPDIKWIASFGDPIGNNPYTLLTRTSSPYSIKGKLETGEAGYRYALSPKRIIKNKIWKIGNKKYLKKVDKEKTHISIENNTLQNADMIILNNKYQFDYMLKGNKELENKTVIIPHTYDLDLYPKTSHKKEDNKIHFAFLGHLDKYRSPKTLFEAVKRLKENDNEIASKVSFDFYGNMDNSDKLYILDNYLSDIINIKESVDYLESLKIMKESDWLINIDGNIGKIMSTNIFFAAKIADYLGSGSNIFSITFNEGASADILREANCIVSSFSSDEIYMHLKNIIYNKEECKINKEIIKKYDAKNVSKEFDDIVEDSFSK